MIPYDSTKVSEAAERLLARLDKAARARGAADRLPSSEWPKLTRRYDSAMQAVRAYINELER